MKRILRSVTLILGLAMCMLVPSVACAAQHTSAVGVKRVVRLKIRSADPQLIYLLLRGQATFSTNPEISTRPGAGG